VDEVLDEELARFIGAPDQRAAGRVSKAELSSDLFPLGELFRRNILADFQVALGRLHVLTEGNAINSGGSQI